MLIDAIADLHGYRPPLLGGDLLIIAGDHTKHDTDEEWKGYTDWLFDQPYDRIVLIGGNHDNRLHDHCFPYDLLEDKITYLEGNVCSYKGLKIYGAPWTKRFPGQSPKAMAFTLKTNAQMAEKWIDIPEGADILITHSPPYGIWDFSYSGSRCGCKELLKAVCRIRPKYHIYGHIHEQGSMAEIRDGTTFMNCSYVNEDYKPVNGPMRIVI